MSASDPRQVLADLQVAISAWAALVAAIQLTNARACLPDGRALAAALADRTALRDWLEGIEGVLSAHADPLLATLRRQLESQAQALDIAAVNQVTRIFAEPALTQATFPGA